MTKFEDLKRNLTEKDAFVASKVEIRKAKTGHGNGAQAKLKIS